MSRVFPGRYILDADGEPVAAIDMRAWAKWFEGHNRHVGDDVVDGLRVSTVFLGIDHNFTGNGPPVLWETMLFAVGAPLGHAWQDFQRRYTSRTSALAGHRLVAGGIAKKMSSHDLHALLDALEEVDA